jgi:hypothetical protein
MYVLLLILLRSLFTTFASISLFSVSFALDYLQTYPHPRSIVGMHLSAYGSDEFDDVVTWSLFG